MTDEDAGSPVVAISDKVLGGIVQRLVSEFQPEEIILFGSHAWGTPTEGSDIDLMVIVVDSDRSPTRRAQQAHRAVAHIRAAKDILVRTRAEFDRYRHLPASLEHRIAEEGRVLYGPARV